MSALYHKEIGLPSGAAKPFVGSLHLAFGHHARQAANSDRYGRIELPQNLQVDESSIVEVEVDGGVAVKAVVRVQFDAQRDLVVVVNRPDVRGAFVRTVWFNLRSDAHKSLRRHLYRQPKGEVVR